MSLLVVSCQAAYPSPFVRHVLHDEWKWEERRKETRRTGLDGGDGAIPEMDGSRQRHQDER